MQVENPQFKRFYVFTGWRNTPICDFKGWRNMVYQENVFCPIILGHICRWKLLKMGDFMFSQGRGIPQFVILQGEGTCG